MKRIYFLAGHILPCFCENRCQPRHRGAFVSPFSAFGICFIAQATDEETLSWWFGLVVWEVEPPVLSKNKGNGSPFLQRRTTDSAPYLKEAEKGDPYAPPTSMAPVSRYLEDQIPFEGTPCQLPWQKVGGRVVPTIFSAGVTALHLASRNGHLAAAELLLSHKAPVDAASTSQLRPLHLAAVQGHAEATGRIKV